jgi:cytidyltransferase-like protein
VSGYWSPLHVGHLELFRKAKEFAGPTGKLVVIVNSNHQQMLKKGRIIIEENERLAMVKAIRYVDEVFLSVDTDRSVCASLREVNRLFGVTVFINGGDRFTDEIPESGVCVELGIEQFQGFGEKIQSSSAIIEAAGL